MLAAASSLSFDSPYLGYAYAYPHKSAYREFAEPVTLHDLWASESSRGRFLYLHVPFCEMRCGFCNLFTQARPQGDLVGAYLDALECQAVVVRDAIGPAGVARIAIGGGTPTILNPAQLRRLLELAERLARRSIASVPTSVETSPETAEWDRLAVLKEFGVSRISLGVQSFNDTETAAVARPQQSAQVNSALQRIRSLGFPVLNLDLIYGLPGQSVDSWLASLRSALRWHPEELYLYPLYVRPETGLGRSHRSWNDLRLACYREAVRHLEQTGYEQWSMRLFRARHAPADDGPVYCVQDDGMVGLGCGARSYTRAVHYADAFAVRQRDVAAIIAEYIAREESEFAVARRGFRLDANEQRRRFTLLTLLQSTGLRVDSYRERFGTDPFDDLPLGELIDSELARRIDGRVILTPSGLERSDAIGPWLYSPAVRALMEEAWD